MNPGNGSVLNIPSKAPIDRKGTQMKTYKILFLPHQKEIEVQDKTVLIRAAMEAGVHINASCGGEGVCGKCRVIIEQGQVEGGLSEKLSREDIEKGYRQACQARIVSDLVVRIPVESAIDSTILNFQSASRKTAGIQEMNFNELKEKGLFVPPVEKRYLEIPEPSAQDNLPDITRLIGFLKLNHDEHRLEVDLSVIRKIPDVLRKNRFKVTATLARPVRNTDGRTRIINTQQGSTPARN